MRYLVRSEGTREKESVVIAEKRDMSRRASLSKTFVNGQPRTYSTLKLSADGQSDALPHLHVIILERLRTEADNGQLARILYVTR